MGAKPRWYRIVVALCVAVTVPLVLVLAWCFGESAIWLERNYTVPTHVITFIAFAFVGWSGFVCFWVWIASIHDGTG
jgi:hypothetical protein